MVCVLPNSSLARKMDIAEGVQVTHYVLTTQVKVLNAAQCDVFVESCRVRLCVLCVSSV